MIVIAILAVAGAIAMPRYAAAVERYQVDAAARRIAADLSLARSQARAASASRTVTFTVSTTASQYVVSGAADPDHPSAAYIVSLAGSPYRVRLTSANFGGSASVTFSGYGATSAGGSVVVRGAGTYVRTVTLDANTGAVTVQ